MTMDDIIIEYRFRFPDHTHDMFQLKIDAESLELKDNTPNDPPEWARLDYHQCPNCPLSTRIHPYCPLSLNLVGLVDFFDRIRSYDEVFVEVRTAERVISKQTSAQRGVSSLMGAVIATCGCPHTIFFKPMARFHLPFSSEEETVYRAVSMYVLAQYFMSKDGRRIDFDLKGLRKIYDNMQQVNAAIAERLREASKSDTSVNSIVLLNLFAMTLPYVIEESLEEIKYLFASYINTFDPDQD
jgi:hypothetical protein